MVTFCEEKLLREIGRLPQPCALALQKSGVTLLIKTNDEDFHPGKGIGEEDLILRVTAQGRKNGHTDVDFTFLRAWLQATTPQFILALQRFSRRYQSPNPVYSVRVVLQFWSEISIKEGWESLKYSMSLGRLAVQLSSLRRSFYEQRVASGVALTTCTNNWKSFVSFLGYLIDVKVLPSFDTGAGYLSVPIGNDVLADRAMLIQTGKSSSISPKNFNAEANSYNEDLFVAMSIVKKNEVYLDTYTSELRHALATIKKCAVDQFEELIRLKSEGDKLQADTDLRFLEVIKDTTRSKRYLDPRNGLHFLKANGGHPNLLGNILTVVVKEMGGLPRPHRKFEDDGRRISSKSPYPYWDYVQKYGKNSLFPYLGIMSSETAAICIILLMMDYPKLNASSVYRAKIEDEQGLPLLISIAGEYEDQVRLAVAKPRAGEEKSVRLNSFCELVIEKVLEWTKPVREEMRKQGRHEEAKYLWVGMSGLNYDLIAFSEKALLGALRVNMAHNKRGNAANSTRLIRFAERYPQLAPWADKLTFKAIRVNSGVLRYLETDGDLVATAKAFGHKNVGTTIMNYIPPALRQLIYERQIRRHQNYLIVSSLDSDDQKLRASDFSTIEELHEFLQSLIQLSDEGSVGFQERFESLQEVYPDKSVILAEDPKALAVAMLYRDTLVNASAKFLDLPDKRTGLKPRFWIEFIDALQADLPVSMQAYSQLASAAKKIKCKLANKIRLPEIW